MIDLKESTTKIHMISVENPDLQTAKKRPEPSLAGITNPRSVSLWLSQTFPHGQGSFEIKLCFRTSVSRKDWTHERMTSCSGCSLWRGALKVYSFPLTFSRHEGPVPQRFWWINKKHLLTSNSLYKSKGKTWGFPSPWSEKICLLEYPQYLTLKEYHSSVFPSQTQTFVKRPLKLTQDPPTVREPIHLPSLILKYP